jgi:lipase chaperone LimK
VNSKFRLPLVFAAVAAFVVAWWLWGARDAVVPSQVASAPPKPAAPEVADATPGDTRRREAAPRRTARPEAPPADSLQGTEVAGGLLVDADGNFVPGPETVAMFEYFLSLTGEKSPEEILAAIRAEIARRLDPPAEAQALAFLDRYMLYRERGVALGLTDAGDDGLRERYERLRSLRREIFGEEVAARLFGDEEKESEVAIRQREVAADPNLSEEEKAARIEKLYDDLPPAAREARDQAMAVLRLQEDEAKLRASGGSAEDIRELRVERFGEEAADRLEDLDAERAEWSSRYDDYRGERERILTNGALSESDRSLALQRLLEGRFDENERIRVQSLDSIEDNPETPE